MTYLQNINENDTGLIQDQQYTMFYIDEVMALTHRVELRLAGIKPVEQYAQYSNLLAIYYVQKNKRKMQSQFLKGSMIFIPKWNIDLKIDTDFDSFSGNALLNFVGEPEAIKTILATNHYKHTRKGIISYSLPEEQTTHNKKLLYPEQAQEESHAVVQRMLQEERQP